MVKSYDPFKERFVRTTLKLPVKPRLPWTLPPIKAAILDELTCYFAGFLLKCKDLIVDDFIRLDTLIGPESHVINVPQQFDIRIPFRVHHVKYGYIFDLEMRDKHNNMIVRIDKNQWNIEGTTFPYAYDNDKLEVLNKEGIPLFQIYIDNDNRLVSLGGIFYDDSGRFVIALPDKLITPSCIMTGTGFNRLYTDTYGSAIVLYPNDNRIKTELSKLKPWFVYEAKPHLDELRFLEFKKQMLHLLDRYKD